MGTIRAVGIIILLALFAAPAQEKIAKKTGTVPEKMGTVPHMENHGGWDCPHFFPLSEGSWDCPHFSTALRPVAVRETSAGAQAVGVLTTEKAAKRLLRWAELTLKRERGEMLTDAEQSELAYSNPPVWDGDCAMLGKRNERGEVVTLTPEVYRDMRERQHLLPQPLAIDRIVAAATLDLYLSANKPDIETANFASQIIELAMRADIEGLFILTNETRKQVKQHESTILVGILRASFKILTETNLQVTEQYILFGRERCAMDKLATIPMVIQAYAHESWNQETVRVFRQYNRDYRFTGGSANAFFYVRIGHIEKATECCRGAIEAYEESVSKHSLEREFNPAHHIARALAELALSEEGRREITLTDGSAATIAQACRLAAERLGGEVLDEYIRLIERYERIRSAIGIAFGRYGHNAESVMRILDYAYHFADKYVYYFERKSIEEFPDYDPNINEQERKKLLAIAKKIKDFMDVFDDVGEGVQACLPADIEGYRDRYETWLNQAKGIHENISVEVAALSLEGVTNRTEIQEIQSVPQVFSQAVELMQELHNYMQDRLSKQEVSVQSVFSDLREFLEEGRDRRGKLIANILSVEVTHDSLVAIAPLLLRNALSELCVNARKSGKAENIVIVAEQEEGTAVIRVSDNGRGIAPEFQEIGILPNRPRMFDSSVTTGGGGNGLTFIWWFVKSLGGAITVSSEPGRGTTFTIRLPALSAAEAPPVRPLEPARAGDAARVLDGAL